MSIPTDPNEKFDEFIHGFDQKINKDTSTLKTISQRDEDSSPNENTPDQSKVGSPILSTPTKPNRNSISLENQPLRESFTDDTITAVSLSQTKTQTPKSFNRNSLKRTSTIGSGRSLPKKGLNLNLSINKQQVPVTPTLKSPDTPSYIRDDPITSSHLKNVDDYRARRRTNSSISTKSSVGEYTSDEFADSLRQLALKEMKIVELKDELRSLQQRIESEETELQKLKHKIGNNFKDISPSHNNNRSPPKESRLLIEQRRTESQNQKNKTNGVVNSKSKARDSVWAKPISFLNQFDQILQNEIEKLNKEAFPQKPSSSLEKRDGIDRKDAASNSVNYEQSNKDDVLNTVSNSLWSFVSDVKHGLLGDTDFPDDETLPPKPTDLRNKAQSRTINHRTKQITSLDDVNDNDNEQEMITIRK